MPQTLDKTKLIKDFKKIIGEKYVLTSESSKYSHRKGFRFGSGEAFAVVKPGSLLESWKLLEVCVEAGFIVIMQAANTGLTGGSTPDGDDYDRPVVIMNTMRIDDIHLIDEGKQIIGLPGSTLFDLENKLKPIGREPHSVIGSTSIGASIVGGICNNSGGSLIQRGPAYTELSLYAQVNGKGELILVNELGIELGNTPEEILTNLQNKKYKSDQIQFPDKLASDNEYEERLRGINEDTPARFNADTRRLYGASGSAGKIVVFAVRLDTYPAAKKK
jgi:D-lactate dehydrogenase